MERFEQFALVLIVTLLLVSVVVHQSFAQQGMRVLSTRQRPASIMSVSRAVNVFEYEDKEMGNLKSVFFHDGGTNGWIGGSAGLYATRDGGAGWRKLNFPMPPNTQIVRIFFSDLQKGWLTLTGYSNNFSQTEKYPSFQIFRTLDGGQTWKLLLNGDGVEFTDFFLDRRGGAWVVGNEPKSISIFDDEYFTKYSNDFGERWKNITSGLQSIEVHKREFKYSIVALAAAPNGDIKMLTSGFEILNYSNLDARWKNQLKIKFTGVRRLLRLRKFGFVQRESGNDFIWMLSGFESSKEGMSSVFFVENDRSSIDSFELPLEAMLVDAISLNDNELVACGIGNIGGKQRAVIAGFKTDDSKFEIIHEDKTATRFEAIFKVHSNEFWAVGDSGRIVKVARLTKADSK